MSGAFLQESSPVAGRRHEIGDGATIGREASADIALLDPKASRHHARIRVDGEGASIEDLGSSNGTFVNDARVEGAVVLSEGDTVRIGETVWRFFASQPEDPRGDVPAPDPVPSAVRAIPAPNPAQPPAFAESSVRARRSGGSAARVTGATAYAYLVVILTAAAVIIYLAAR